MFTSTASPIASPRTEDGIFGGLVLSGPTVIAGSLIASALIGRAMAWLSGGATVAQLVLLLVIALAALGAGHLANSSSASGSIDAKLAKLTLRAGAVQTALGVATLTIAVL